MKIFIQLLFFSFFYQLGHSQKITRACNALNENKFEKAFELFSEVIEKNADEVTALVGYGRTLNDLITFEKKINDDYPREISQNKFEISIIYLSKAEKNYSKIDNDDKEFLAKKLKINNLNDIGSLKIKLSEHLWSYHYSYKNNIDSAEHYERFFSFGYKSNREVKNRLSALYYKAAKKSNKISDYQSFIQKFPKSYESTLALKNIEQIEVENRKVSSPITQIANNDSDMLVTTLPNGNTYEGGFVDGKMNGFGTYTFVNGQKYVGNFKDGKYHGKGTLFFPTGEKYEGYFKDDKFNGHGILKLANGNASEGEFTDGKLTGMGTYSFANGGQYIGELIEGKMHGHGTYTFPNGNKYVGQFKEDKFNGQGIFSFATGEKKEGQFKDGLLNGQGTVTLSNGDKYVGEFKNDQYNGQGTLTFSNGEKYVGAFLEDKMHGQGKYTYPNRDKYVGEFKDDKFDGKGVYIFSNGDKYIGLFKDGKFVRSIR